MALLANVELSVLVVIYVDGPATQGGVTAVQQAILVGIIPKDARNRVLGQGGKDVSGVQQAARAHWPIKGVQRINAAQQRCLGFDRCDRRVGGIDQSEHPGDVRCGHRGATLGAIACVWHGRINARAWGDDINRGVAKIGKARQIVGRGRGGNRDDVVQIVGVWIIGVQVIVAIFIACCGDKELVCCASCSNSVVKRLRIAATAPGVVGQRGTHLSGVFDGQYRIGG